MCIRDRAHAGVAVALAVLVHLEFQHLLFGDVVRNHALGGALGGQDVYKRQHMEQMLICLSIALIAGLLMSRLAKAVNLPAVTSYPVSYTHLAIPTLSP